MRPDCAEILKKQAGRTLTDAELQKMEKFITQAHKDFVMANREKAAGMSLEARMAEAGKIAKQRYLESVVQGFEQSIAQAKGQALRMAQLRSVKAGKNGQVQFLYDAIDTVRAKTHAIASSITSTFLDPSLFPEGKFMGLISDPTANVELARAAFGENASPEAKQLSSQFTKSMDTLLERARTLGIPIHRLERYAIPIDWDTAKMAGTQLSEFIADAKDRLARDITLNPDGTVKSDAEITDLLKASHSAISTDGAVNRIDGAEGGKNKSRLGANLNMERQLHWKSAADWSYMQQKYGVPSTPYELINTHITRMAHTLALAETFGTDIDTNWNQLLAQAKTADIQASGQDAHAINGAVSKAQRAFEDVVHPKGAANAKWSNIGTNVRGGLSSVYLGNPFVAVPDTVGLHMTAAIHGIPAMETFGEMCKGLALTKEGRDDLFRLGLAIDPLKGLAHRMDYDMLQSGPGKFLNELTFKVFWMNRVDGAIRYAAARGVSDILGKYNALDESVARISDPGVKRMADAYGVTDDHWAVWKLAEREKFQGRGELLTAPAIMRIPDESIEPLAAKRAQERGVPIQEKMAQFRERMDREFEMQDARNAKFEEQQALSRVHLEEIRAGREFKLAQKEGRIDAKEEIVKAQMDAMAVRHDIQAYLRAEKGNVRLQKFLQAVEDGQALERQVIKRRTRESVNRGGEVFPDIFDPADSYVQDYTKAKPISERSGEFLQDYARDVNAAGERLGRALAKSEARISEARKLLDAESKAVDKKSDVEERKNAKRFLDREQAIEEMNAASDQRIARVRGYMTVFGEKNTKILAEEVFKMKAEAAEKLQESIYRHTQVAARGTMGATEQDRIAMQLDRTQGGSLGGELHRFMLQFKSTPIGIFRAQWNVAKELPNANWKDLSTIMGSKQAYRAKFAAYSLLAGALTREINAAINGQDPRTINPETPEGRKFWLEAMATGGGLGLWGEYLTGGQTRAGAGAEVFMGPGIGAGIGLLKEYQTAVKEANKGESTHAYALAGSKWIRQNAVPLAKGWYVRTAFNRLVYDQVQEYLSPGINERRIERQRKQGITSWWEPGEALPGRAPDVSRMVAGEGE